MNTSTLLQARGLQAGLAAALFAPIDLALHAGSVTLVSGENGVGKSSLMRTLAGEQAPFAGTVQPAPGLRICHFSQHAAQLPGGPFSVDDLLRLAGTPALVHPWVPGNPRQRFDQLSGGQRQRLLLAMALTAPCDLLLLDEPAQNLDATSRLTFRAWLEGAAARSRGPAIVVVTHDAETIQAASRVHLQALPDA